VRKIIADEFDVKTARRRVFAVLIFVRANGIVTEWANNSSQKIL